MALERPEIFYSLIAKDDIILVENKNIYFKPDVLKDLLKEVKKGTSCLMPKEGFNFALLTTQNFSKTTVVGFIESIKKSFDLSFPQKDFKKINEYGLNKQFQETLKEKMNLFNDNPDCSSEEIIFEKEKLKKQRDELFLKSDTYDSYDRGEKLGVLDKKQDSLSKDSSEFYKTSKRKRKKCIIF